MVMSGISGMILPPSSPQIPAGVVGNNPPLATSTNNPITSTFGFNVSDGGNAFFGVLEALRQDNLMKIAAEPTLVTSNGVPAKFDSGGTFFIPVPQSLGTISAQPYTYGTTVEFVPIVLGNGKIRLQVRPTVSELDYSNATVISGSTVPGTKQRSVDTTVEMTGGETLAIAGLVQTRTDSSNRGLPYISDVPYIGTLFRKVHEQKNEVELLILVTPELVDPLAASEVPPCGPGMQTTSPSDWELYTKGHLEVPVCPPGGACARGCRQDCGDSCVPQPDGMMPDRREPVPAPTAAGVAGQNRPNNRYSPANRNFREMPTPSGSQNVPPGFIGPVGYDVVK